jgi:hypothetical protein
MGIEGRIEFAEIGVGPLVSSAPADNGATDEMACHTTTPPEPCYSFPITEVDVEPYVLDEEAANFRERINSARGRAWLGYFGNDEHWARIYGEMDAVEAREAESIIEGVETLGLRDTPIGQRATEIANNNLQGIALTNAARVVAARGGSLISGGLDERPIRGCGRL